MGVLLLRLSVPLVSLEMFSKSRMYIKVFELGLIPLCESLTANLPCFQSSQAVGHRLRVYLQSAPRRPSSAQQSLVKAGRQLGLCFQ